jgi:hypothetical protein
MERPARRARLPRGRRLQDNGWRPKLVGRQRRPSRAGVPRTHRHRHRAIQAGHALRARRQLRDRKAGQTGPARRVRAADA